MGATGRRMPAVVASLTLLGTMLSGCGVSFCASLYPAFNDLPMSGEPDAVRAKGAEFAALAERAPADIRADVLMVSDALQRYARAVELGDPDPRRAVNEPALFASVQRLNDWEEQNC